MTRTILINAIGTPRPQPRPRQPKGQKHFVSNIDPNAKLWRAIVGRAIRSAMRDSAYRFPLKGEIEIKALFRFKTRSAKRLGNRHNLKPDIDNLLKLVMDALEKEGMIGNDSGIHLAACQKLWDIQSGLSLHVMLTEPGPDIAQTKGAPWWLTHPTVKPEKEPDDPITVWEPLTPDQNCQPGTPLATEDLWDYLKRSE